MLIRRFTQSDAQAVSALIRETLKISNASDYPAHMIDELVQRHTPEYVAERAAWTHFYVAEENGRILGCGAIGPYWDREDESSLFSGFVDPAFQGRGIGRQLVETLEKDEYALRAVRIEVPASITGLPFYRAMGYEYKNGKAVLDEERLYRLEKFTKKNKEPQADADSAAKLLQLIHDRHSYRGIYQPDVVPREDLQIIMEAGLAAPSGCNKQTTSLMAVDDPEILKQLRAVIDPPVGETAPALILVLTRRINAYRDRCFAVQDYSAAIENMLLAIKALGYESCWYEGHITDTDRIGWQMAQILGVPTEYDLVCMLPVGKPAAAIHPPKKKPFEDRAWFNRFGG